MKKFLLPACITFLLLLNGCHQSNTKVLTVGTISGPETELVETAKDVAKKKYDLDIKIVEFNDYNLPNEALNDKSLDANVYQHLPYLEQSIKTHGFQLKSIGKTFIYPMAIYSSKHKKINTIPKNAIIAIPNDPSNENRALLLLAKAGLITLNSPKATSIHGIKNNPKNLVLKEMDAAQLPRVLQDVDAAVINTTFAIPSGLSPKKDSLFMENKDSPYANIIVVRDDDIKTEELNQFVHAFQSKEVKQKAKELFGDSAISAW